MKNKLKKRMTTMPRQKQEEKLEEFLQKLDENPLYEDDELLGELDNDLVEVVLDKLEGILNKILEDIEYLQMPREKQEEEVKNYLSMLWINPTYEDKKLLEVLDADLLERIAEEQSVIIEDMQHELYELEIRKRSKKGFMS